jgi:probable rRNA maturation factor
LRALVRATLRQEQCRPGEIGIVLADDALLRRLNRQYRSLDRTTDVLSFGYDGEPGTGARGADRDVNGDLVISLDRVSVQARRYRVSPGRELARLLVHGTLHLAGLEHDDAATRVRMRRAEARALRAGSAVIDALERALRTVDPKGMNRPQSRT